MIFIVNYPAIDFDLEDPSSIISSSVPKEIYIQEYSRSGFPWPCCVSLPEGIVNTPQVCH